MHVVHPPQNTKTRLTRTPEPQSILQSLVFSCDEDHLQRLWQFSEFRQDAAWLSKSHASEQHQKQRTIELNAEASPNGFAMGLAAESRVNRHPAGQYFGRGDSPGFELGRYFAWGGRIKINFGLGPRPVNVHSLPMSAHQVETRAGFALEDSYKLTHAHLGDDHHIRIK